MQLIFARGRTVTDFVTSRPLYINNVGYYRDVTENLLIERECGRKDYHFIFVSSGVVESNFGKAREGECIVYKPREYQRYEYLPGEKTTYFWVHYSGTEAESVLSVPSGIVDCGENASQIHELLMRATKAIADGMPSSDKYAEGIIRAACALIEGGKGSFKGFGKVISMMKDFGENYSTADYAAAAGYSEGYFIRSFKRSTGKTPIGYQTAIKVENAKALLVETSLKIETIASLSGFSDALYFSRVFKRETGLSPSEFRKQC